MKIDSGYWILVDGIVIVGDLDSGWDRMRLIEIDCDLDFVI